MPYGISKSVGGDSLANVAKVHRVKSALMKRGYPEVSAIKIAKSQLTKKRQGRRKS